ncbi:TetR/AcrR family transcriptional regulator [Oricola cellulosilytica]|nr:TetR/AcrR family transcriptional regulator [Oricola cellulosilytica]
MLQTSPDKRGTILSAAFDVFINYGFRKTSMDDIARAAGMSRPALYQIFRNKSEIFRGLSRSLLESTATEAISAFHGAKPFSERLYDALDVSILSMHRKIDATPHGMELIGVNEEIASDIEEEWCQSLIGVIAKGIEEAARTGEVSLEPLGVDAHAVASIVMQAMEGMKSNYLRGKPIEDDVRNLVAFVSNALTKG